MTDPIKTEPPETYSIVAFGAPRGLMDAALARSKVDGVVVERVLLEWCEEGRRMAEIGPVVGG